MRISSGMPQLPGSPLPVVPVHPAEIRNERVRIKKLLSSLEQEQPGIKASLLAALGDIDLRHLLVRERQAHAKNRGR
jgi:tRNA(Ile)-lysidine synthase TilS/MesJ